MILCEWDTCGASVKELEESMNEEAEMREEKERYNTRRGAVTQQEVIIEECRDEGKMRARVKVRMRRTRRRMKTRTSPCAHLDFQQSGPQSKMASLCCSFHP